MNRIRDFASIWWMYTKHHNPIYAAKIAYGIVYHRLPF